MKIGISEWVKDAEMSVAGRFRVKDAAGEKTLWSGTADSVFVTVGEAVGTEAVKRHYVVVGSYRSYETATFVGEEIGRKFGYEYQPAHPEDWVVWLGPYVSLLQAAGVWAELRDEGMLNTDIRPEPAAPGSFRVKIMIDGNKEEIYKGTKTVILEADAGNWEVGERRYRGRLAVVPDSYGTVTIVNLVKVDDYLRGVLAAEMPAGAEMESLKAQAVIARTYLMKGLGRHRADGFDLCAGPDCQVYRGIAGEKERTDRAVGETRGMLLYYGDELANPLFHSTCGGRTAGYADVWPGKKIPYLASVNDGAAVRGDLSSERAFRKFLNSEKGYCRKSKYFRWKVERTRAGMEKILQEKLPALTGNPRLEVGRLKDIKIAARERSGRLKEILISTASGDYRFRKDEIRWALGGMRSTFFTMDSGRDKKGNVVYTFHGAGWGHGVGLCQIGAMELGRKGWKFDKILSHYYPGTKLRRAWR